MKVTVLLPTYKRPILIRRSLDSIFNQAFDDYELIVIENGSDEEMHERYQPVIDDLSEMDGVTWLTFDWASLPKALNEGLQRAKGEYLSIMEDDDEWHPDFLEKMSKHLDNCTCGMVYCRQIELDPNGQTITAGIAIPKRFTPTELFQANFIGLPMAMYRTKALKRINGFDEQAGPATDWITHCFIYAHYDIHMLQHVLVTHYWQPKDAETPNYCLTKDDTKYTALQRRYLYEGRFDPK